MATDRTGAGAGGSRRGIWLLVFAVVFMAGAIGSFVWVQQQQARIAVLDNVAQDVRNFYLNVIQVAAESSRGLEPNRAFLTALGYDFEDVIETLREGDPTRNIPPLTTEYGDEIDTLEAAWAAFEPIVDEIIDGLHAAQQSKTHSINIDGIASDLRGPSDALLAGTSGTAYTTAALLRARLEELRSVSEKLVLVEARVIEDTARASELAAALETTAARMVQQAPGALSAAAEEIANAMPLIRSSVDALVDLAPALDAFNNATIALMGSATPIETAGGGLENRLLLEGRALRVDHTPGIILGVAALLTLGLFIVLFTRQLRQEAIIASERDARQQQAILELLDEITNLADGDLTVDVTVTEDFTGAIADSINYTVANMRSLVGQITSASAEIAAAASATQKSALKMSAASEQQAREVAGATTSVTGMSESLQEVASRAQTLAQQAQTSVTVAHTGAETVDRTIGGMTALREQIQDTSKRIKRLGESSQEIGNITELINDIAEQTNTLALNASIQAAMAGESGRGFAVVADEVQRLAERAANATRQIENLVKTIQADTNEAIISMERSTANVVTGARAAEEAGQALTQIETASTELAQLMETVAAAARDQSAQGNKIADVMKLVREIAVETAGSSQKTSEEVGELTSLSEKLRESVAGFKLPG
jgi:twitching motility protein PilJ